MSAVFLRIVHTDDKAEALANVVRGGAGWYQLDPMEFTALPASPFMYTSTPALRRLFRDLPRFGTHGRSAKHGAATLDDLRFVRTWFEIRQRDAWAPVAKGGRRAPFFADIHLVVRWADDGGELKAYASAVRERNGWGGHWTAVLNGYSYYFRPGLTWPHRSARFSASALPAGCVFSQSGKAAFAVDSELAALLAVFNSSAVSLLIRMLSDAVRIKYEVGVIQRTPVPDLGPTDEAALASLARRAWSLKRSLDTRTETSHAFVLPALLQVEGDTLADRAAAWTERVRAIEAELERIQADIDERCFELYGIDEDDRRSITEGFVGSDDGSADGGVVAEDDEEDEEVSTADTAVLAAELVSWTVGVAFGRFDVRLASGERPFPEEPEPFDPLPVCSPGMLTGEDGPPLDRPPPGYPLSFPDDGVLVDDPGHPRDLAAAVRNVFDVVFGDRADDIWQETITLLAPKGHDLRRWLASGFFDHHLRTHSKSRRKAPIVWQLAVSSGRYGVWCYAHRMSRDSLLAVATDVVGPKLAHEERRLSSLRTQAGTSPGARERAEIAAQEAFVEELRVFLEEVRRVAPLWSPDLDDGIVLVLAPLWRLVPTHKAWQKELRSRWEELVAGRYDWAHLAMHLWPGRVVPKCAADRSLAIAHGLEGVFWAEGADGKWTARSAPTRPVAELVPERTSPAVKAALQDLLAAPAPASVSGKRSRKVAE